MTALLARWTEKLAGGPQAGTSDSPPLARVMGVGGQQQHYGGVNVFHVCLNFNGIYGVGVCVNVCVNNNNNNNNFISSILLIVVLHVYNGNKRHIKRATHTQYVPYNKNV